MFDRVLNGSSYSRMGQVKFVKDSLSKIWSDMVCLADNITLNFLRAVFHKFHLVHSLMPWTKCVFDYWQKHSKEFTDVLL